MSPTVTMSITDWNYVVGILALRGEKGSPIAAGIANQIHAQVHGGSVPLTIQTVNESFGPVPVDLHVALVAAYDAEHMSLTEDPDRRDAIAIAAWEWLATGDRPLVNVVDPATESDG